MANLSETPDYPAGVYQLETSDPVLGGPGGIANRQAEQLANRTSWLKAKVDAFISGGLAVFKATKLATARTLSISGAGSGSASFDGSANATIALTLADSGAVAGTYTKVTITAKGIVTGGAALVAADIPSLDWSKINSGKPTTLGGYGITDAAPIVSPIFTGVPAGPTAAAGTNTTQFATTAFVTAADNLKAPLASPTFTGTPAAPTAAAGTNTTQLSTTAFVQAAIAALVESSPSALNTLNELAAALGDDPNFATTMATALGLKAPLASPALSGTPTAPTAAAGTNTTQVATTAFVAAVQTLLNGAIALKAPLASPAMTGTPTAPTAADGTNTTQLASTAFVQAAVGGYLSKATTGGTVTLTDAEASNPVIAVSGALTSASVVVLPATTKRLWAIYNATSGAFTVTVKTAAGTGVTIAQGKRNLVYTDGTNIYDAFNDFESIALTGTPTALTAAVGNSTTQVATTAFVNAEIANDTYLKTEFGDRVTSKGGNANGTYRLWASGRKDMLMGATALTAPSLTLTLPIALTSTFGANARATVLGGAGSGALSVEVLSTTQIRIYCATNCNVMIELNGDIA